MPRCRAFAWTASLALAGVLGAQPTPTSVIHGQVVDPQQVPLPGVEVELIDFSSGQPIAAHTDARGRFSFSNLATGKYSLAFQLEGYVARRLGPYELLPGVPRELNVELHRLSAPLTRAKAGLEGIALEYGLVREQIESVPVLLGSEGRTSADKLLLLVPGMSPVESLEISPFSGRGAAVSANGSRRSAINYMFDGAPNNSQNRLTGAQAATFGPVPEAVETFRVITHTYSAKDGRNAGAVVAPITRSGGAAWHGQLRTFWRPGQSDPLESFDGSNDSLNGWAGGGQLGGPISREHGLFLFLDAEGWRTQRRHNDVATVLTVAERAGDLAAAPAANTLLDPGTLEPYPNGTVPASARNPLIEKYLDAFVPLPNLGANLHQSEINLDSSGQMLLGRIDYGRGSWSLNSSHHTFRNTVLDPLTEVLLTTPGMTEQRRQLASNSQLTLTYSPSPRWTNATRFAVQRLSIGLWQGNPEFRNTTAQSFGFDFESFGSNPGMLPDLTLFDNDGTDKLRIAPFLFSESSVQTTLQISNDLAYRQGGHVFRGGIAYHRGIWPFSNFENPAGSFGFGAGSFQGTRNSVANLLTGIPSSYRLQTPRSLDLRWHELSLYGEVALRPLRGTQLTLGVRYESQPPAVDRLDRIAAFREDVESQRFEDTLPNLIFAGDPDGELGALPRSTISSDGRQLAPRVGLTISPSADSRLGRWIFGEAGRSVFRASYGMFYDFGTLAGSSAAALFQATYPPFSTDRRFNFTSLTETRGSFEAPLSTVPPLTTASIRTSAVSYPIRVFDRNFENALAHHWTVGWQRLLPGRVFVSATYVGTRSLRLQRQRELNVFSRSGLFGFGFIRQMRKLSQYSDIRQFESSGNGRYHAAQIRATRYLTSGLAFDVSYNWAKAFDNGSTTFGDELATEIWARSNFDRRNMLTASWFYQVRLAPGIRDRLPWADRWQISGIWRLRGGLPLDIRQTQDPTFSFVAIGRPDQTAAFRRLDPGEVRTFTLADGRTMTGRFALDPTAFERVVPTDFDELRPGTVQRNAFTSRGFQQWDLRITRPWPIGESMSATVGLDLLNVLNHKNWDLPFQNIDHPFFGIVRTEGLSRTFQANVRFNF